MSHVLQRFLCPKCGMRSGADPSDGGAAGVGVEAADRVVSGTSVGTGCRIVSHGNPLKHWE